MYTALMNAYDKTVQLVDELKTLHNNIRRYHQALNEYATVNDILKGHFDEYKNLITDRIYHPLKTLDSVPRFKGPILKILSEWLLDYNLRKRIGGQAIIRGKYQTKAEADEDIILKIGEISDIYERLEEMLEEIDRKNSAYTRASIEKMRYLLNSDRSVNYLGFGGWTLQKDSNYGVISLANDYEYNRVRFDRNTTLILYTLRLIFEEEREKVTLRNEILTTVANTVHKMIALGLIKKKTSDKDLTKAFRQLDNLSLGRY
jgi:hypothetical protein